MIFYDEIKPRDFSMKQKAEKLESNKQTLIH